MIAKQEHVRLLFPFVALLLTLSLAIVGCGGTPTPKPQPTFVLEVSPGAKVQEGKSVAIVAKVEPLEKLDLEWSVSGTAEGTLNAKTGEQVVYTAGKEGVDIVVAEGTTASGVPVKETVSLTVVVGEPVAEVPTPTDTPVPPAATPAPPTATPPQPPTATPTTPPDVTPTSAPSPVVTPTTTLPTRIARLAPAVGIPNGCPITGSAGSFEHQEKAAGALKGTVKLSRMTPTGDYLLTLNGWPGRDGNENLKQFNVFGNEGYLDFITVTTDSQGNVSTRVDVALPAGRYEVKFFVKDPTSLNFCVVLFNNNLVFTVE